MTAQCTEADCTCVVCNISLREAGVFLCESCSAVTYCSLSCKQHDWVSPANPDHGHQHWCAKMKYFMFWEPLVCQLPFTFAPITTSSGFCKSQCVTLLLPYEILTKGLWKYEFHHVFNSTFSDCISAPGGELYNFSPLWTTTSLLDPGAWNSLNSSCCIPNVDSVDYEDALLRAYVSPSDVLRLSLAPPTASIPYPPSSLVSVDLMDWSVYYIWRGLSDITTAASESKGGNTVFSSPLAILLHWPLTIYHILANLLPKSSPDTIFSVIRKQSLIVHIIGVEHELSVLPVFKELHYLIRSDIRVRLLFVGRHIDAAVQNRVFHLSNRLSVGVYRGLYHTFVNTLIQQQNNDNQPDVIIAFNAGLAAYPTWPLTLETISMLKVPAYFTDACLYSTAWGYRVAGALGLGEDVFSKAEGLSAEDGDCTSAPLLNPFRSPLRLSSGGTRWGWFRNAFIYTPLRLPSQATDGITLDSAMAELHM